MKIFYTAFLLAACTCAHAQRTTNPVSVIKAQRAASNAAIAKHDVEGIAQYWAQDFVQVRGNASYLTGKEAVKNSWTELFKTNPGVLYVRKPSKVLISKNDSLAWEKGKWTAVKSYSKGGNYAAMWRKINNEWKIQAELFVSLY